MYHALVQHDAPWELRRRFPSSSGDNSARGQPHEPRAPCFDLRPRMDDRQSGIAGRCGPGSSGRAFEIAGAGCRRQRHSSGTWECARTQRLGRRPQRHRQRGQSACDTAAGHKPGSRTHRILSHGYLPIVPGATSRQDETNASCGIEIPPLGGPGGRQGARQAAQRQDSKHLPGMLNPLPGLLRPAGAHRRRCEFCAHDVIATALSFRVNQEAGDRHFRCRRRLPFGRRQSRRSRVRCP
jgi:hypothetical protein